MQVNVDYNAITKPIAGQSSCTNQIPVCAGAITGNYRTAHQIDFTIQLAVTNRSINSFSNAVVTTGSGVQTSITFGVQKVF